MPSKGGGKGDAALIQCADASEAQWVVENLSGNIPEGLTEPITVTYKKDKPKGKGKGKSKGFAGEGFKGKGFVDAGGYGKAAGGQAGGAASSPYGGKGGDRPVCRNFQQWGEC